MFIYFHEFSLPKKNDIFPFPIPPTQKHTPSPSPPQSSGLSDCLPEAEDMAVKVLKKVSDLATWKKHAPPKN